MSKNTTSIQLAPGIRVRLYHLLKYHRNFIKPRFLIHFNVNGPLKNEPSALEIKNIEKSKIWMQKVGLKIYLPKSCFLNSLAKINFCIPHFFLAKNQKHQAEGSLFNFVFSKNIAGFQKRIGSHINLRDMVFRIYSVLTHLLLKK